MFNTGTPFVPRTWKPTTSANRTLKFSPNLRRESSPMLPNIRSAAVDDIPGILAIERQAPNAAHWTPEQYNKSVEGGFVLVAEIAGQVCGFVCANAVAGE